MKKKVRIYKAPDGKGKYVNKTSKFLAKAQMGGTPDPSMLSYPGSQPTGQQNQTDQIVQFVVNDITNKVKKEETLFKLINVMGIPMDAATQLYITIAEKLTEDIEKEDDISYENETGLKRQKEAPLTKDAIINESPEEETDYDLYDDTGSDIVMQESEGPDILDEALDPLEEQRYGGSPKRRFNDGGEYDVALPSSENYESLVEPMTGYDLVSQMAWSGDGADMSPYLQKDYANTTLDYSNLQKGGAYKKAKKKYVNSVMNLLKKQMGGTNESDVDPNQGDPTGSNFREGRLKSFTDSVRQNAEMSAMQNQIEQQYDQMMQEGGMTMPEQDVENPMHHLQLYSQAASGVFGEPMNQTVKARRGLSVQNDDLLNLPRGFYRRTMRRFGDIPNLREVDVRKSGLFGPKQYTMYFDPLPLQQLNNPLSAQVYGYGSGNTALRKQTRTFDAVKTYTNLAADATNKESLKEVEGSTPKSDATSVNDQKSNEAPVANVSNVQRTPVSSSSSNSKVTPVVTESLDAWGRKPDDRWYGFDPDKKIFTKASSYQPSNAAVQLYAAANPEGTYYKENGRYYKQVGSDYFEIVDPARIRQLKESQVLNYQKIPGVNTTYSKDAFGNWVYYDEKAGKFKPSTDAERLKSLQSGKNKSAAYGTLDSKPGYYYRIANDGSFIKYKGDPATHTPARKPVETIKKDNKSYNYMLKNIKVADDLLPVLRQYGGVIENPFNDPLEPLQKFVGGGYDPSIADLTENQIQYMDSKDVTDAYMQGGGFIKNFIPANLTRSSRNDVIQRVYNPLTGETRQGGPGPGNYISAIDVRKRGITGAPKKYTIYYGAAGDPRYQDLITLDGAKDTSGRGSKSTKASERQQALENAGYGDRTDVTGLKGKSKRAIRQGERKRDRDLEKLYKEDPTNVEFEKTNINAPYDYQMEQPMQIRSAQDELNKLIKQGPEQLVTQKQIDDLRSQVNMDWVPYEKKWDDYFMDLFNTNKEYRDNAIENNFTDPDGKSTDQERNKEIAMSLIPNYSSDLVFPYTKSDDINKFYDLNVDPNNLLDPRLQVEGIDASRRVEDWYREPKEVSDDPMLQDNGDDAAWGQPADSFALQGSIPMVGPLATEEDQLSFEDRVAPFAEEYLQEGYQPAYSQDMLDQASGLRMAQPEQPMTDMGAWSGNTNPLDIVQPGVNPFELPVSGGEQYYPPFEQPIAPAPAPVPAPAPAPSSNNSLDALRAKQRKNSAGRTYTYTPNMSGMQKDPDYIAAMKRAGQDGVVTNQESQNAVRVYKQKLAEQEKAKIASQAQRTINQIMNTSASPAEKRAAREKVILEMQQRWDLIDKTVGSRKYGGALSKFVGGGDNQPFTGDNPVAYTNNPAMQGKSDLDMITLNPGIQGAQGQVNWGSMSSPGIVNQKNNDGTTTYGVDATYKGPQAPEIKIDPMQREEYQVPKTYAEPLAIDVKNKLSQGEREARLIAANSLMRGVAGFKNRIDDSKQMADFYDNFSADNLYASDPSRDRGDYAESGLYRPDEQGQTWYGRSAQMGGYIDDDFEDGEEVYMTDEEIKEYMANGGQIEFI